MDPEYIDVVPQAHIDGQPPGELNLVLNVSAGLSAHGIARRCTTTVSAIMRHILPR